MTEPKGIPIRNVYYMLSYAFQYLGSPEYEDLGNENFENIYELFAEILIRGITHQLKQGLYREYIAVSDAIPTVRGRINIYQSFPLKIAHTQKLHCEFDEFSENNIFNQILKTTAVLLSRKIRSSQRDRISVVLKYLSGIDEINLFTIHWSHLVLQKNNKNYEMLINICHFIIEGLLLTSNSGDIRMANFIDDKRMHLLFEKFVLEYYRKHFPALSANPSGVEWDAAGETQYLPSMRTDIMLTDKKQNKVLIIDTKYYGHTMQMQFDKNSYHSGNMYQIFSYVKNKEAKFDGEVYGMVLYAKTNEEVTPNQKFSILGNKFMVTTLDLNKDFEAIRTQLNIIQKDFLL